MRKINTLAIVSCLLAGITVFAFSPPLTPWGKHSSLGCLQATIVGADNCELAPGVQCQVMVGTGPNAQSVDVFADQSGCMVQDDSKRLRRALH